MCLLGHVCSVAVMQRCITSQSLLLPSRCLTLTCTCICTLLLPASCFDHLEAAVASCVCFHTSGFQCGIDRVCNQLLTRASVHCARSYVCGPEHLSCHKLSCCTVLVPLRSHINCKCDMQVHSVVVHKLRKSASPCVL